MFYKIVSFSFEKKSEILETLRNFLNNSGAKEVDSDETEYIFVIGGDGSFINFVKEYAFQSKKIIGIKSGNLSFLPDFSISEIKLFDLEFSEVELLLVKTPSETHYAFNDLYISGDVLLTAEIYIDDCFLELFKGVGLLVSTQKGSTAQNKSLGGPILSPESNLWLINEVGSNNTNKGRSLGCSIVLGFSNKVKIRIPTSESCRIYIDGRKVDLESTTLEITLIKGNSKVIKSSWNNYINKLSNTFLDHVF